MTVSWRRSAESWGFGSVNGRSGAAVCVPSSSAIARSNFRRWPERDTKLFEVLIGQVARACVPMLAVTDTSGRS
jgi:hypothetical protein